MKALAATMERRGFGYVAAFTLLVTLAGAAGMYAFEDAS
jgi:voltage-gated potassium channel